MRTPSAIRAVALVCVAATLLLAGACSKDEKPAATQAVPTPSQVLQDGVNALRRNEVDKAIQAFTLIAEKAYPGAPERPVAFLYLGEIALRAGNAEVAAQHFQAALKLNPDMPQARLSLGNAYFSGGRVDEALQIWEQLAKDRPNLASVHNNLGIAYTDKGDLDNAISHLEQAISLSPDNYQAHENLANAYRKKGMTDEADATQRKAEAIKARLLARRKAGAGAPPGGAPAPQAGAPQAGASEPGAGTAQDTP
jgi:tetratricopeptide (TPR) repeat protein